MCAAIMRRHKSVDSTLDEDKPKPPEVPPKTRRKPPRFKAEDEACTGGTHGRRMAYFERNKNTSFDDSPAENLVGRDSYGTFSFVLPECSKHGKDSERFCTQCQEGLCKECIDKPESREPHTDHVFVSLQEMNLNINGFYDRFKKKMGVVSQGRLNLEREWVEEIACFRNMLRVVDGADDLTRENVAVLMKDLDVVNDGYCKIKEVSEKYYYSGDEIESSALEVSQTRRKRSEDRDGKPERSIRDMIHTLIDEVSMLKHNMAKLQVQEARDPKVRSPKVKHTPACRKVTCIIPSTLYADTRLISVYDWLTSRLSSGNLEVKIVSEDPDDIEPHDCVLIPCVTSSRVGSDIDVAVDQAKLESCVNPTVLVFNHLAPHNSTTVTPTRDRVSIRERCTAIIDLVFWNGNMYDCERNQEGCQELLTVIKDML